MKHNRYNGVLFDLDGVLCATDRYHYQAWKELADEIGVPFDESVNDRLRGVSRMASLEIVLERCAKTFSPEEKQRLADRKNERYRALLQQMSPRDLGDGVGETLRKLRESGVLLAVASSSKNTPLILKRLGLEGWFDAVADGNAITRSKPDPEVFVLAAEMLKLPPRDCLVVEDAAAGIEAARRGGFDCAGLGEAAHTPGTTYPIGSVGELTTIVTDD